MKNQREEIMTLISVVAGVSSNDESTFDHSSVVRKLSTEAFAPISAGGDSMATSADGPVTCVQLVRQSCTWGESEEARSRNVDS